MSKKIIITTLLILAVESIAFSQKKLTAEIVLQKSLDKINSLKTVKYKHSIELNYPSTSFLSKRESESFIDITEVDNPLKVRYQFDGRDSFVAFNGSTYFRLERRKRQLK